MHTDAFESTDEVLADSVLARTRVAVVDETVAVGTRPPKDAVASVSSHKVVASCCMLARTRLTLINLGLAIDARKTVVAAASVAVDLIHAKSVNSARIRLTLVDFFAAVYSGIPRLTRTGVVILTVVTGTVNARI